MSCSLRSTVSSSGRGGRQPAAALSLLRYSVRLPFRCGGLVVFQHHPVLTTTQGLWGFWMDSMGKTLGVWQNRAPKVFRRCQIESWQS